MLRARSTASRLGLSLIAVVVAACSERRFTAAEPEAPSPTSREAGSNSDSVNLRRRHTSGTPTDVDAAGGTGGVEPTPAPGEGGGGATGASGEGGVAQGGDTHDGTSPPTVGGAGEWDGLPDPPVDSDCASPILEPWTEELKDDGAWHVAFGDPFVDTVKHQLVLSYDDVAQRTRPYQGGYYVDAYVHIDGSTVFTPYPNTFEVLLPSLRRDVTGKGVELGATQYGQFNEWSKAGWGAASGTVIEPTQAVRVTAYIQATSKAFALKVTAGDQIYRSTWVTDFHWPATNLGIMRYVGENNSGTFYGGSEYIYLSVLKGCQNLSDSEIEARFAR